MVFSDDDLKRLKTLTNSVDGLPVGATVNSQDILALLARLEAAEKVCEQVKMGHEIDWPRFNKAYAIWRKASGNEFGDS